MKALSLTSQTSSVTVMKYQPDGKFCQTEASMKPFGPGPVHVYEGIPFVPLATAETAPVG